MESFSRSLLLIVVVFLVCMHVEADTEFVQLSNAAAADVMMPVVGLGTGAYGNLQGTNGQYWDDENAEPVVIEWLKMGGKRLDTSLKYYNDINGVGRGIAASGVPREDIFITSKVDDPYGYETTLEHIDEILVALNTSYVDLLLIHWPGRVAFNFTTYSADNCPNVNQTCQEGRDCRQQTWKALVQAFQAGKARAIGVSNFQQRQLQDVLDMDTLIPAVNQIEFHPYFADIALVSHCQSLNITVNGYSPLGAPDFMAWHSDMWPTPLLEQEAIVEVARKYNKTAAQVVLRWEWQHGVLVHPRTRNVTHMKENLDIFDFELTSADMDAVASVPRPLRSKVCPDPLLIP